MTRQLGTGWFASIAAAVLLAAGFGLAADQAFAAKVKNKGDHKVKAQIKHGTLVVEGTPDDDQIVLRLRFGDPTRVEVVTQDGVVGHNLRRDRFDQIFVDAGEGNDRVVVDESNGVFTDADTTTLDGGAGNDELLGGRGNETFDGGPGNDSVDGNQGADAAFLGTGDDSFTWDPGDGSDVVEGEDGFDKMVFNGAAGNEVFEASNNGGRLRFTRNLGNIVMDVDGTELVDLNALGGSDATTVNDLSATDVTEVAVDLAAAIGGNTGDGAADTVTVNGTNNADNVQIFGANASATAGGLAALTRIGNADAIDTLVVNGLGGNDVLSAPNLAASAIALAMNGGSENDTLLGGAGIDRLSGDSGNDVIDGNQGNDTGFLGTGDDSFIWDPGDGSDVVEGGDGFDTMVFNGAAGGEIFDASNNGGRLRFTRNLGNIVMDVDDTERVDLRALGGADATTVNDLSATDVVDFAVDLAAANGGNAGDNAADTVTVNGTNGDDVAAIAGANGSAFVAGLSPFVRIAHAEAASDRLLVSGLGGGDAITAGPLAASAILLTLNGGTGNDMLRGGSGNDVLSGGPGVDFLDGAAGVDQISCGGAGDTIVPDPLDVIAADCS